MFQVQSIIMVNQFHPKFNKEEEVGLDILLQIQLQLLTAAIIIKQVLIDRIINKKVMVTLIQDLIYIIIVKIQLKIKE